VLLGKARWPDLVPEHEREKLRLLVANTQPTMIRTGRAGIRHLGRARAVLLPAEGRAASPVFYAVGPMIAVGLAAARRGAAVICQSGYEGFGVALLCRLLPRTWRPQFVVEVHGDWRTAVNGYGDDDGLRSRLGPVADAAARWALREADVVRAVSAYTERLARDAGVAGRVERFATFEDAASLLVTPPAPMPDEPRAVYVGSLEPVKGVDVLLEAWGEVRRRVPEAVLVMAGDGSRRAAFGRDAKALGIEMRGNVPHDLVAGVLDDARFLIVPSRSEGLGRVILEAFARGRPVVGTSVGGIPEMVRGGRTGILVPPEDALALADAIVRAFEDPAATAAMGVRARATAESRDPDETFEAGFARLAAWVGGR
jgi:glycosyltransferase involved in cell wall biosynthesis